MQCLHVPDDFKEAMVYNRGLEPLTPPLRPMPIRHLAERGKVHGALIGFLKQTLIENISIIKDKTTICYRLTALMRQRLKARAACLASHDSLKLRFRSLAGGLTACGLAPGLKALTPASARGRISLATRFKRCD